MISDSLLKIFDKNPQLGFVCAFFSDRNRADLKEIARKMPQNSAFIFREYDLNKQKRQELALEIFAICKEKGCKFLIGKDLELARKIGADGAHFSDLDFFGGFDDGLNYALVGADPRVRPQLARSRPRPGGHAGPPRHNFIISLACHNLQSVQKAQNTGADVIFLAPIFTTKSHIDAKILGLENLAKACKSSVKPVFALGGITQENLAEIINCGAKGFGGIEIFVKN